MSSHCICFPFNLFSLLFLNLSPGFFFSVCLSSSLSFSFLICCMELTWFFPSLFSLQETLALFNCKKPLCSFPFIFFHWCIRTRLSHYHHQCEINFCHLGVVEKDNPGPKGFEEAEAVISSATVQGCTHGVGVSVVLHVGPTMLVTVGNKILVWCKPRCAWGLNIQIPVLVLWDVCINVPKGCGMNSGKSALETGFCGVQGPGNENHDSTGGSCS